MYTQCVYEQSFSDEKSPILEISLRYFYNETMKKSSNKKLSEAVKAAVEFIDLNYDQQIKLADIANEVNLSVSRISHLFKEQMNLTPIEYLTEVRINHAKKLLKTNKITWQQIAFETGFSSENYFARTFKNKTGKTPKQFQENSTLRNK